MNEFPKRLKELREEVGLSKRALAKELNTTEDSIYSWEKGRCEPSFAMLCQICYFFKVSSDYLLGLEDESGGREFR